MKKTVILLFTIIAFGLSACGQGVSSTQAASSSTLSDGITSDYSLSEASTFISAGSDMSSLEESAFAPEDTSTLESSQIDDDLIPFDVIFDAVISEDSEEGHPYVIVNTNLPDTTIIKVKVYGPYQYSETKEMPVVGGIAISEPFDDNGYELENGNYSVKVETKEADEQPDDVREVIGEGGCNLVGECVEDVGTDKSSLIAITRLPVRVDIEPAIWSEDVSFSLSIAEASSETKWIFNIDTNLPSGMELGVHLKNHNSGKDYYFESSYVYLNHGDISVEFVAGAYNTEKMFNSHRDQTVMPNGEYLIQIDTNFYNRFPLEVLEIIGSTGENLNGPFIKEGNDGRYLSVRMVFNYYDGVFSDLHYETTEEYANLMGLDVGDDGELVYPTSGESKALRRAKQYLKVLSFSYEGLVDQLEFEGFTHDEAVYGVDHCEADWYEQAVKKGESYLELFDFSRAELINQLEFEGFTTDQAEYAVNQLGM